MADGFGVGQAAMNLVEVSIQIAALLRDAAERPSAWLLAFTCSALTLAKTMLYFLSDFFGSPGKISFTRIVASKLIVIEGSSREVVWNTILSRRALEEHGAQLEAGLLLRVHPSILFLDRSACPCRPGRRPPPCGDDRSRGGRTKAHEQELEIILTNAHAAQVTSASVTNETNFRTTATKSSHSCLRFGSRVSFVPRLLVHCPHVAD